MKSRVEYIIMIVRSEDREFGTTDCFTINVSKGSYTINSIKIENTVQHISRYNNNLKIKTDGKEVSIELPQIRFDNKDKKVCGKFLQYLSDNLSNTSLLVSWFKLKEEDLLKIENTNSLRKLTLLETKNSCYNFLKLHTDDEKYELISYSPISFNCPRELAIIITKSDGKIISNYKTTKGVEFTYLLSLNKKKNEYILHRSLTDSSVIEFTYEEIGIKLIDLDGNQIGIGNTEWSLVFDRI